MLTRMSMHRSLMLGRVDSTQAAPTLLVANSHYSIDRRPHTADLYGRRSMAPLKFNETPLT